MKPFNLEHAKAGAPLQLDDGRKAEVLKFDANASVRTYNLIGLITNPDGSQWVAQWNNQGVCQCGSEYTLHMTPLGQCEGKHVYTGDELQHKTAASYILATTPNDFSRFVWPKPQRVYPVTQMSGNALVHNLDFSAPGAVCAVTVANAAIRHGIDNSYLVDPAELDRLSEAFRILAPKPKDLIDMVCNKYEKVVKDGNHWAKKCGEANETIAKQNKIITDMAAANAKLIKDHAAAQSSADKRGHALADIAKLVGMSDGYTYKDVPYNVKAMLDAKQTAINERNNILIEIAKGCKLTEQGNHWLWAQIPTAVRLREVAIAKAFFYRGIAGEMGSGMPDLWFEDRISQIK